MDRNSSAGVSTAATLDFAFCLAIFQIWSYKFSHLNSSRVLWSYKETSPKLDSLLLCVNYFVALTFPCVANFWSLNYVLYGSNNIFPSLYDANFDLLLTENIYGNDITLRRNFIAPAKLPFILTSSI